MRVHLVPQASTAPVHAAARAALVAERPMLGDRSARGCTRGASRSSICAGESNFCRGMRSVATETRGDSLSGHSTPRSRSASGAGRSAAGCGSRARRRRRRARRPWPGAGSRRAAAAAGAGSACASCVFGQTEYCIAWPSPSRYGTQLKYGASNGLLWVLMHRALHDEVEQVRSVQVDEVEDRRVLQALDLQLRVGAARRA